MTTPRQAQLTLWHEPTRQKHEHLLFALQGLQDEVVALQAELAAVRALVQARERTIARQDLELAMLRVCSQIGILAAPLDGLCAIVVRRLRTMIAVTHPDKWDGHPLAHEVTTMLLSLRDALVCHENFL